MVVNPWFAVYLFELPFGWSNFLPKNLEELAVNRQFLQSTAEAFRWFWSVFDSTFDSLGHRQASHTSHKPMASRLDGFWRQKPKHKNGLSTCTSDIYLYFMNFNEPLMIVSDRWQVVTNVWNFMVWHPWLRRSLSKICSPLLSNRRCGLKRLKRRNWSIPPRHARHVDQALMERLAEVEQHMEQLGEEQELMYELRAVIVHRGVVLTSVDGIENRNRIATNQRLQWWPP